MNNWYRVIKSFPGKKRMHHFGEGLQFPKDSTRLKVLLEGGYVERLGNRFGVLATSKLANVEIADRDYTEGDKTHFTFEEALSIEQKLKDTGWRLPTRSEWALIAEEFGQKDGKLDAETLLNNLNLVYGGIVDNSSLINVGEYGYYWSSTAIGASLAYNLYFNTIVSPSILQYRYLGLSVRLVRDVEKNK